MERFKESLTLCEIEKILEDLIQNRRKNIRIIGDLNLSKEDYRYLAFKVKSLVQHQSNMELAKRYKYSIIFYLIYSHHYETEDKSYTKIHLFFENLQQYQLREFINILTEAFIESGFDIYGLENNTLESFNSLILMHVGLVKKYRDEFFLIMNDLISYIDIKNFEKVIRKKLPPSMAKMYRLIDKENFDKILNVIRTLFIDCKVNNLTKSELYDKYVYVSSNLIEMCYDWCKKTEEMVNMHMKA